MGETSEGAPGARPRPFTIIAEGLVSAGRRHGDDVRELCEDAVGMIVKNNGVAFYVVDATSDEPKVGPFSSRYLANCLGHAFLQASLGGAFGDDAGRLFAVAVGEVSSQWRREWEAFSKRPDARAAFARSGEGYSEGGAPKGRLVSFSCAFAAGFVRTADRHAEVVRTGDIDLIVKRTGEAGGRRPYHKDRIFAQIVQEEGRPPEMRFPAPSSETFSVDGVEYIIVKSDGVRFSNEELSIASLAGGDRQAALKFRRILLKGIRADSGDDRSLFYAAFIESEKSDESLVPSP